MPESKTPDMERIKKRVLTDYKNAVKPKELSEKYGIKVNTIKSWIRRADKGGAEKAGAIGCAEKEPGRTRKEQ